MKNHHAILSPSVRMSSLDGYKGGSCSFPAEKINQSLIRRERSLGSNMENALFFLRSSLPFSLFLVVGCNQLSLTDECEIEDVHPCRPEVHCNKIDGGSECEEGYVFEDPDDENNFNLSSPNKRPYCS